MGGAVALLASQGHAVTLVDMTDGEPTPFGDAVTRAKEAAEAAKALSTPRHAVARVQLGLTNRRVEHTLEARHKMAGLMRATAAQLIFLPNWEDAHPDHRAVTRIVEDARFDAKLTKVTMPGDQGKPPVYPKWLIYYYATHLRIVPAPTFILDISAHLEQKMRAIAAYRSQFAANPANRGVPDMIRHQAAYFGSRIGAAAGEPFFCHEPLGLMGLGELAK